MPLPSKCVKIAIDRESIPAVREWAKTLNARGDEVLTTLREEGVFVEAVFLEESEAGAYLIYFIKALDLARQRDRCLVYARDRCVPQAVPA